MALIATFYQAGKIATTAQTDPETGVVKFSNDDYASGMGLTTGTTKVWSEDLKRVVTIADGDLYLIALPDMFQTSTGQGTSVAVDDPADSDD